MHPDLFSIGPLQLHSYGLLMAIGFLGALGIWKRLCRGTARDSNLLSSLMVWMMISGVVGARIAYVAEHLGEYADNPISVLFLHRGGLMFYGGFAGAGLGLLAFARRNKEPLTGLIDLVVTALPFGHAMGRIGCFLNGCCHGRTGSTPVCVAFPQGSEPWHQHVGEHLISNLSLHSLPVHPVQLYEAAINLLIFAILVVLYRRPHRDGLITSVYLLLYPPARFALERFRADPRLALGPLSIGQCFSILLVGIGLIYLWVTLKRPVTPSPIPTDEQPRES